MTSIVENRTWTMNELLNAMAKEKSENIEQGAVSFHWIALRWATV